MLKRASLEKRRQIRFWQSFGKKIGSFFLSFSKTQGLSRFFLKKKASWICEKCRMKAPAFSLSNLRACSKYDAVQWNAGKSILSICSIADTDCESSEFVYDNQGMIGMYSSISPQFLEILLPNTESVYISFISLIGNE
jgi:hypothetical protein